MSCSFDVVAYLKLFRFPLVFTAIADSAAGYLVFTTRSVECWVLTLLAICSGGLYFFGMAMNDIADVDRDRQSAAARVLPSGRISLKNARYAALISLAISFEAVVWLGMTGYFYQVVWPWCLAVGCILCYDLHWFKVPPMMGLVRGANLLIGITVAIGVEHYGFQPNIIECLLVASPVFFYGTALTSVSTLEDQREDRKRPIFSAVVMVLASFSASSVLPFWYGLRDYRYYRFDSLPGRLSSSFSIVSTSVSALLAAWIIFRCLGARDRKGIMVMVRDGVAGIILLDTALVMSGTGQLTWGIGMASLLVLAAISVAIFKKLA